MNESLSRFKYIVKDKYTLVHQIMWMNELIYE